LSPVVRVPLGVAVFLGWMTVAFGSHDVPDGGAPRPAELPSLDATELTTFALRAVSLHDGPALAMPTQIAVISGSVVLVDGMAERPIHILDADSGDLVRSLGRSGEGPGEFQWPRALDPADGESFWVYDAGLSRLTLVEPERWASGPASDRVTLPVRSPAQTMGMVRTASGLLGTGLFADGRLGHFDEQGVYTGASGSLPTSEIDAPPGVLQHAYRGTLKPDPTRERLVLAARHAGFLEVFASDGSTQTRFEGPFPFEPAFEVVAGDGGPSMATGDDLRFGYVDVAPTAGHVYALFSGRTRGDHPDDASYGRSVHVFDWDGSLRAVLELDVDAFAIAVDEERGRLLAVRHLPTPSVVTFDLPGRVL
jgi:hypothetical protein